MQTGTIAFLLGVLLLQLQPELPTSPWLWLVSLTPAVVAVWNRRIALLLFTLVAGFVWAYGFAALRLADTLPAELEGKDVELVGQVVALPERSAERTRFLFDVEGLTFQGDAYPSPQRVRLSWYQGAPAIKPGQRWRLTARLKRPRGMMNPGGFDYEAWLFREGIRATGYVRSGGQNQQLEADIGQPVAQLRYRLQQQLKQALSERVHGGIIRALAIGDRSAIDDPQWAMLLSTGTNHLMAISGLHIGLVAGLCYYLLQALWSRCTRCCLSLAAPRAAAIAAILAAALYAALAGFSVPTQRAMLMLLLVMAALFWQRPIQPSRVLTIVLLLVLLHDPLVVHDAGFWLSFAAVAIILYGMSGRLNPAGLWWRWGRVQWLLALGLMPLVLLLFGQTALVGPLANLIAVPWIGLLVVPLTLIGTLALQLWGPAGEFLLQLADWSIALLWPLLDFLAESVPAMQMAAMPWWVYLIAGIGLLWLLAPRGWPLRWLGGVLILPLLSWQPVELQPGEARFTLLDVGQGLAAVVETKGHVLVFDTGPRFRSGFNTGRAVVVPFLRQRGHKRLDLLIVSHGDNDHIGGARAVVETMTVERVVTSVPQKMGWVDHALCRRGSKWIWDDVEFELLHPERMVAEGRGNNDSCVLRVVAGGESLLLTGDIEQEAESELIAAEAHLRSDILVAPHHGSKTSSSAQFVEVVAPRWVLLPLGHRNRYGFPHPEVQQRYQGHGATMLSTAHSGAITFLMGQGELSADSYRVRARRYWHATEM